MDEVRRLRRQLHATWAVIGVGVLVAAVPRGDDEIKARRFVVVDERGVERASLESNSRGETRVRFDGQKDGSAAWFGTNRDGRPSLYMKDPGTEGVMSITWLAESRKILVLAKDGDGSKQLNIGGINDGPAAEGVPAGALPRPRR